MQQQMAEIQERAAQTDRRGRRRRRRGAASRVTGGDGVPVGRSISPEPSTPTTSRCSQDLVLAALHDAVDQVQELQSGALGGVDMGGSRRPPRQ